MAILNEYAIMGPNYWMLVFSIIGIVCAGLLYYSIFADHDSLYKSFISTIIEFIVAISIASMSIVGIFVYDTPQFEIPTGKKYIEATFAKGSPTAAILQKYDVIDVDEDGKVYLLKEKDGVKDEKRPKVRIGNE